MKQNVQLFFLLIGLLAFTYYFQEIRPEKLKKESQAQISILKKTPESLVFNNIKFNKNVDGQWISGDELMSQNKLNQVIQLLMSLERVNEKKIISDIDFSDSLTLRVDDQLLEIGDLTIERESFYVKFRGDIILARFAGERDEILQEGESLQQKLKLRLKSLVDLDVVGLRENQLFRFFKNWEIQSLSLNQQERKPFSLNLKTKKLIPAPYDGLELHEDLDKKILSLLTQIQVKEFIKDFSFKETEKIAQATLTLMGEQRTFLILRMKEGKSADVYLQHLESNRVWKVIGGTLKLFFISEQDLWNKKNMPHLTSFHQDKIELKNKTKRFSIKIFNREPFLFEPEFGKLDSTKIDLLTRLVLNLKPFEEAERVSRLLRSDEQYLETQNFTIFSFQDQSFTIWTKPSETIVCDKQRKLKFHYPHPGAALSFYLDDVIR